MRIQKRRFPVRRLFALLLTLPLLICIIPAPVYAAPAPNPVMRIGLFAGDNALIAANLQNYTGSGYIFGYMDSEDRFQAVGVTDQIKITMVKNRNVYLDGSANYYDAPFEGAVVVGAFHEEIGVFDSYEEAAEKTAELRAEGKPAFVAYIGDTWRVRSGNFADSGGGVRVSGSKYCVSVVVTGTNDIIFQFDGGESRWPAVQGRADEGVKPVTWFKGNRYYGTFEYRRMEGNNITVVNAVEMQDYIKGVIPYEMSASWPIEALKAQALCAKSFAIANKGRHKAAGYDLCYDEHCQVYKGTIAATAHSDRAVDETYGCYITYNGSACNTVYHTSDGGATENSENVWVSAVPYLRGVVDPFEDPEKASYAHWQFIHTNATLTARLTQRGYPNAGIVNFYVEKFTDMGNVYTITFVDSAGKKFSFSKESVRTVLGVHSMRYTVGSGEASLSVLSASGSGTVGDMSKLYVVGVDGVPVPMPPSGSVGILSASGLSGVPAAENSSGTYVVDGRGSGHNVGMSQYGARGMAELGYTFDQIVTYYFTGTSITGLS